MAAIICMYFRNTADTFAQMVRKSAHILNPAFCQLVHLFLQARHHEGLQGKECDRRQSQIGILHHDEHEQGYQD
ncbi:MAG: hypothetical protein WD005_01755, partial [Haliea sp.]